MIELVRVMLVWGDYLYVAAGDLEKVSRRSLPIYTRAGVRRADTRSGRDGCNSVLRENLAARGTPRREQIALFEQQTRQAIEALYARA